MKLPTISRNAQIGGAVALALSGAAHALPISDFNANADQVTVYVGGATAQEKGLEGLFQLKTGAGNTVQACLPNTLDQFHATNQYLFFCRPDKTKITGLAANVTRLAVFKSGVGGSGNGVGPLVRNVNVAFFSTGALSTCAGVTTKRAGANFSTFVLHEGCTVVADSRRPDAGLSDVEPVLFKDTFNPSLSTAELGQLTSNPLAVTVFGVPTTLNLYRALQRLQFPTTSTCHPSNAGYNTAVSVSGYLGNVGGPVGQTRVGDTEACMPSLSDAQLAAIVSGNYSDWSQIVSSTTAGVDVTNAGGVSPSNTSIYMCRRAVTSGTQATFETALLAQRCVTGAQTFVSSGATVSIGSGSGDVLNCLNANHTANRYAVGVLSTEFVPGVNTAGDAGNWRFIKKTGYAPNLVEVVSSNYDFWVESTFQWNSSLANPKLGVAQYMATNLGSPDAINDINAQFVQSFGSAGLLGLATSFFGNIPTPPLNDHGGGAGDVSVNPVAPATRSLLGPNSCAPAVTIGNTQSVQ